MYLSVISLEKAAVAFKSLLTLSDNITLLSLQVFFHY